GDSVNLAARLEGANKYYDTYTMISHFTYDQVKDEVEVRELDTIRVVGKKEPITVYELLETKGNLDDATSDLVRRYNSALALYKNRQFDEAKAEFESIVGDVPEDGPSKTYISRCDAYLDDPPGEDWDGVYNLTAK
ncbi:MAG: adenylate/guanylate cyclase domain-containing protein, partial [Desulfobacterales bacterium]|nr:adenylate/guanylate cyclase domain-containing protein [Desulfobacterales bacterium]